MNRRTFLALIILLSCALIFVGAGMIGATLFLQGQLTGAASFATPSVSNALLEPLSSGGLKEGALAPDFTGITPEGETVRLSDFRGKPVMINFWASWCGPCTAEMKNIESVYQEHLDKDFVILAVNQSEGDDTIKGYGELWKLHFRLLRDPDNGASRSYNIRALPTTIFLDHTGAVYQIHIGGPMSVEFIKQRVEELLAKVK